MAHFFSQNQIDEYRDCFSLHDSSRKGVIRADDLARVMRSLYTSPTTQEIRAYRRQYEKEKKIQFDDFLLIMDEQQRNESCSREILDAFYHADVKKQGYISVKEFKRIMCTFGEKLKEREVDAVLREFGIAKNGQIQYADFVKKLLTPIPDSMAPQE
ncbi:calmodulin-like protein 4 [Anneissia japonica]|uniref:calmodulin-like protein 4 n=1 Tax=Anneissia japonica TaxID=1529436 RepID=UPI001425542C|nr:calmodulin-like protein 4 [Anneissia japonica]